MNQNYSLNNKPPSSFVTVSHHHHHHHLTKPVNDHEPQFTFIFKNKNLYDNDEVIENLEKKSIKSCFKNDFKLRSSRLVNGVNSTSTQLESTVKYINFKAVSYNDNILNTIFKSYLKFKYLNRYSSNSSIEIEKSIDNETCKPGDRVLEINDTPIDEYNLDCLDLLINNPNEICTLKIESFSLTPTSLSSSSATTTETAIQQDLNNNSGSGSGIVNRIETSHNSLVNDLAKGRMRDCCLENQQQDNNNVQATTTHEQQQQSDSNNTAYKAQNQMRHQLKQRTRQRRSHSLPNTFDIDSLLEYLTIRSSTPATSPTSVCTINNNNEQSVQQKTKQIDYDYLNRIINTFQQQDGNQAHQTEPNLNQTRINIRRARSFRDLTTQLVATQHQVYHLNELDFNEKIGEGFFAYVKKVRHRQTGKEMVIKELKVSNQTNYNEYEYTQAYKSFLKEAQILRNLKHPNIIKFYGVLFTKDRHLNLILEYISGGTLKDIVHNLNSILPWKLRVSYAKDIAYGMEYLHSLNIIHRDLKSDNCLVRENGSVVIADFGLSRVIEDETLTNLNKDCETVQPAKEPQQPQPIHVTESSGTSLIVETKRKLKRRGQRKQRYAVVGNSFSMAPEMLKHQVYDERVDIFSFGILCCEVIGRVEADPDYLPRTTDFGLNVELFRKKYCEADCPKHFIQIAIACCELEPEKRPPFSKTHPWLETILLHLETNNPIPKNLLKNILNTQPQPQQQTATTNNNNNMVNPATNVK